MRWFPIILLLLAAFAAPAGAAEHETTAGEEEIIERILELRRQLDELLAALPPELRAEVERRWQAAGVPPMAGGGENGPAEAEVAGLVGPGQGAAGGAGPDEPTPAIGPEPAPRVPVPAEPAPDLLPTPPSEPPPVPAPATTGGPPPPVAGTAAAAETGCGFLTSLDGNGDGKISAADRFWRYLYLWSDDGDGRVEESELRSLYDEGIREVSARLRGYSTADGGGGDVWSDGAVRFDLRTKRGNLSGEVTLVINAGGLLRSDVLRLLDAGGTALDGHQPLAAGVQFESADGIRSPVLCPD